MKFEDTHIGGRELGPVQFAFSGDDKAGQRLVNFGRTVLGNLKQRMQMAGVMAQETEVRLDDGSTVYASSILGQDGAADIDRVGIFVPVKGGKKKKVYWRCTGFVAHASQGASSGGFAVYMRPPFGEDYEFLFTESSEATQINAWATEMLHGGTIPATYELNTDLGNWNPTDHLWRGVPFYWIHATGSWIGKDFFNAYTGSVGPISAQQIVDMNASQPILLPRPGGVSQDGCDTVTTDWTAEYQFSRTRRNERQHVSMVGKPKNIRSSGLTFEKSQRDGYIAVLSGSPTFEPDIASWQAFRDQYGTSRDIIEDTIYFISGPNFNLNVCGVDVVIGDRFSGSVYNIYARSSATTSAEPTEGFQLNGADVPAGLYRVLGFPDIDIYATFESTEGAVQTFVFRFTDLALLEEVIHIQIASGNFEAPTLAVQRVNEVTQFVSEISEEDGFQRIHWVTQPPPE